MSKKDRFEINSSLAILLSFLGFTCLHFLLDVFKDVACKLDLVQLLAHGLFGLAAHPIAAKSYG
jgi:hypothetical protein